MADEKEIIIKPGDNVVAKVLHGGQTSDIEDAFKTIQRGDQLKIEYSEKDRTELENEYAQINGDFRERMVHADKLRAIESVLVTKYEIEDKDLIELRNRKISTE